MDEAVIYCELTTIIRDVLMQDELVLFPGLTAKQVHGWDSFQMIEIILAVEARFDIKVPSQRVDQLETVGDFVALIMAKREVVER